MTHAAQPQRIAVALSGGVDSAVAAALLREEGHEVVGLFARGWSAPGEPCDWRREAEDAARVASHLGIRFRELDLGEAYRDEVVGELLDGYRAGRTPNPDVWCNRRIKFGHLAEAAREMGAEILATGHYARIEGGRLYRGADAAKDQSYFLWTLTAEDLVRTCFPLGDLEKATVRDLARKFGLPVAEKPDSQGVCFVGALDLKDFLRRELQPAPGPVLDLNGEGIGQHDGAILYTVGERGGFRVVSPRLRHTPLYVQRVDVDANAIYVAERPPRLAVGAATIALARASETRPGAFRDAATAQVRYRGEALPVTSASTSAVQLASCPVAVAPGQSLVLYAEDGECLGGGEIDSAAPSAG